ncbi:unnamed protein product [Arabidopsis halleri]
MSILLLYNVTYESSINIISLFFHVCLVIILSYKVNFAMTLGKWDCHTCSNLIRFLQSQLEAG